MICRKGQETCTAGLFLALQARRVGSIKIAAVWHACIVLHTMCIWRCLEAACTGNQCLTVAVRDVGISTR